MDKYDGMVANGILTAESAKELRKANRVWDSDAIQFPRLISEIYANIEFTDEMWADLEASMDLSRDEILELFERADTAWQNHKRRIA